MNCRRDGALLSSGGYYARKSYSASHVARCHSHRRSRRFPGIRPKQRNRNHQGGVIGRRCIGLPRFAQLRIGYLVVRDIRLSGHIRRIRFHRQQRAAWRLAFQQVRKIDIRRLGFRLGKNVFGRFLSLSRQARIGNGIAGCISQRQRHLRRRQNAFFRLIKLRNNKSQQQVAFCAAACHGLTRFDDAVTGPKQSAIRMRPVT